MVASAHEGVKGTGAIGELTQTPLVILERGHSVKRTLPI